MLYSWMDLIRDRFTALFDGGDSAFLQIIERWHAIERDIHNLPDNEPEFLAMQVSFLILVNFVYARIQLDKEIDDNGFVDLSNIATKLCEELENNDEKFVPYLELLRFAITSPSCNACFDFSAIFKTIHEEVDANIDRLLKVGFGIDILSPLYQEIFTNPAKHASGEHYTPVALCDLMYEHIPITIESTILDPTCGAGAFLVSAIDCLKRRFHPEGTAWLKNVHGEDINPVAIIAARVNAWMQARDLDISISYFFDTIRISDILENTNDKLDFIIGNPPWITLKDFTTTDRQKSALILAKELQIAPDAHGVPQLELATIVFAKCLRDRLGPGGQIFLILTSSFIDGKHCSKFRAFMGIDGAKVWIFEGEPVFPRKFACLLAKKGSNHESYFDRHPTIDFITWQVTSTRDETGKTFTFTEQETRPYSPVNQAKISRAKHDEEPLEVEKLIPVESVSMLLPTDSSTSHYKALCYNGATIFPQSLLFVDVLDDLDVDGDSVVTIRPAFGLNMKKPWNVRIYESASVERRYIFDLVKGSELYPFGTQEPCHVFLPLKPAPGSFVFDGDRIESGSHISLSKSSLASSHFARINKYYKKNCKKMDRIANLWARINFDNELTNPGMKKPYKVIFPDCGSTMAAAIVRGPCIVEHALHYIGLDDEEEAYYLLGVLNAPSIEKDVLLRKAERHIGQLLLDYLIPRFDPENHLHHEIASFARQLEKIVKNMVVTAEASMKAMNEGKYQCMACLAFMKDSGQQAHARSCKKFGSIASTVDEAELFVKVDGNSNGKIRVKFTRDAIKKKLNADASIQHLLSELDVRLLHLLETREG